MIVCWIVPCTGIVVVIFCERLLPFFASSFVVDIEASQGSLLGYHPQKEGSILILIINSNQRKKKQSNESNDKKRRCIGQKLELAPPPPQVRSSTN